MTHDTTHVDTAETVTTNIKQDETQKKDNRMIQGKEWIAVIVGIIGIIGLLVFIVRFILK